MKKLLIIVVLSFVSFSQAYEVSFSGIVDADVGVTTDSPGELEQYETNQEIDLTTNVEISDNVSLQVYTTILQGPTPLGRNNPSERFGNVIFDGVTLTWSNEHWDWYFIDLVYQGGSFEYYRYSRSGTFATVIPETFIRGFGFDHTLGFTVSVGVTDAPARTEISAEPKFAAFASYEFEVGGFLTLKPLADVAFGGEDGDTTNPEERAIDYHAGGIFDLDLSLLQVNLDLGLGKEYNEKQYYAATASGYIHIVEQFGISGLFHWNSLEEDTYSYLPEQAFAVIEPTVHLTKCVDLVLGLEVHDLYEVSTLYSIVPGVIIKPHDNVTIAPRVGYHTDTFDGTSYSAKWFANLELQASF